MFPFDASCPSPLDLHRSKNPQRRFDPFSFSNCGDSLLHIRTSRLPIILDRADRCDALLCPVSANTPIPCPCMRAIPHLSLQNGVKPIHRNRSIEKLRCSDSIRHCCARCQSHAAQNQLRRLSRSDISAMQFPFPPAFLPFVTSTCIG